MLLDNIRTKINLVKNVDIRKVHVLLLPEDETELASIKRSIITLKPKQGVAIHYEHGLILISIAADTEMSLKIMYRKNRITTAKHFITRTPYEIINFTLNFLRGDYESFTKI
jgi:hypothetical protein